MLGFCLCRRSGIGTRFTVLCSAVFILVVSSVCGAQNPVTAKRILLLYPFDNEVQTYSGFDHALRSRLRSRTGRQVEFYTEYLDLVRFPAPTHSASQVRLLKLKYATQKPDLIVLDLNMPEEDGLSIIRTLKQQSAVPIIMLTATAGAIDRIVGLELGADDYLAKPCELRELLARIRSVLRRSPSAADRGGKDS